MINYQQNKRLLVIKNKYRLKLHAFALSRISIPTREFFPCISMVIITTFVGTGLILNGNWVE